MFTEKELDWFFRPNSGQKQVARYPLTNIGTDSTDMLYIEVAVAGFDKSDIDIEIKGNELHISGSHSFEEDAEIKYTQRHISTNDFTRIIVLSEDYVGGDIEANVNNGILTITIQPKEPQRKLISIS